MVTPPTRPSHIAFCRRIAGTPSFIRAMTGVHSRDDCTMKFIATALFWPACRRSGICPRDMAQTRPTTMSVATRPTAEPTSSRTTRPTRTARPTTTTRRAGTTTRTPAPTARAAPIEAQSRQIQQVTCLSTASLLFFLLVAPSARRAGRR